jgi:photosynthetic reaction center cytochrome c subunit
MPTRRRTRLIALCALLALVPLTACDRPPVEATQMGFRGVAIEQVDNPRRLAERAAANQLPPSLPPLEDKGKPSSEVYQNVQVLGHVGSAQFARLMGAITVWVAPKNGCTYCHANGNFVEDNVYTKTVARRMIQMTQHINSEWSAHVGETGVTCYTCHRGQVIPSEFWTADPDAMRASGPLGYTAGQNEAAVNIGLTSLPTDPFTAFLAREDSPEIRVQSRAPLPTTNISSIKQTEWTYSLMVHMSTGLGVNCTYCHNSRSFGVWGASSPARATAWHGIRMVRDLNENYMDSLTDVFPANRKGPMGDVYKINCATCHQGVYKPLYGAQMAADYPELWSKGGDDGAAEEAGGEVESEGEAPAEGEVPETDEAMQAPTHPDSPAAPMQNADDTPPGLADRAPAPA